MTTDQAKPLVPDLTLTGFASLGFFMNWNLPRDEQLRLLAEDVGADTLVIGVPTMDFHDPRWRPRWSMAKLEERLYACFQAGLDPVVMPWAVREPVWLNAAIPWLAHFGGLDLGGCDGDGRHHRPRVLLDAEPDRRKPCWHRGSIRADLAAQQVADGLDGLLWGVSGLDILHGTVKALAALAAFKVPQGYSIWKPQQARHWSHTSHTFPGYQQDRAFTSWTAEGSGDGDLIMGLADYWQARPKTGLAPALAPGHTLRLAAAETRALGVKAAWYWAVEHLTTRRAEGTDVRRFFGIG